MDLSGVVATLAHFVSTAAAEVGVASPPTSSAAKSGGSRGTFQWGGTIFALFLLILNRVGRRSRTQDTLLILYLLASIPTPFFKIIRGELGCWAAFLAVAANLYFPKIFSVSRLLLFVTTPEWLANGLRNDIFSAIFCLIIGIIILMIAIRGPAGSVYCECNLHCFCYYLCIAFLLFFAVMYI